MDQLKIFWRRLAISLALKRPSPSSIPLSGDEVKFRRYRSTFLVDEKGAIVFSVRTIKSEAMEGLWFAPDRPSGESGSPASVPMKQLAFFEVSIRQYHGELELRYISATDYLLNHLWQPTISLGRKRIGQWFYNQKKFIRADRMAVLRLLVETKLENNDGFLSSRESSSELDLTFMLHGDRWVGHPDRLKVMRHYRIVLDSLVESEDLQKTRNSYSVLPKAIATLSQYERDEQRHRDMSGLQRTLVFLTAGLVLVGIAPAITAALEVWQYFNPPSSPT